MAIQFSGGFSKPVIACAVGVAACAGVGVYIVSQSRRSEMLEIRVFNTPGSPSVFIRAPHDQRIVIGGGSNSDIVRRLTEQLPFYSRRIDMAIAPTTDATSVTGMAELLHRYAISRARIPAVTLASLGLSTTTDAAFAEFMNVIDERTIPLQEVSAGDRLVLDPGTGGDHPPVTADILFPAASSSFQYSRASAPQLLMRISYGRTHVILAGMATPKIQKFLTTRIPLNDMRANAVIFSQSLAAGNIAPEFLRATSPQYFIYSQAQSRSASRNPVYSATKKADLLAGFLMNQRFNIQEKGEVVILSDGQTITVK